MSNMEKKVWAGLLAVCLYLCSWDTLMAEVAGSVGSTGAGAALSPPAPAVDMATAAVPVPQAGPASTALVQQKLEAPAKSFAQTVPGGVQVLGWLESHWLVLLGSLLLLLVIAGLAWWIWTRRGDEIKARWEVFLKEPEISPYELVRVLTAFHEGIPRALRAKIKKYPVCVVMGDARSGKTELIKRFTHIEAQVQRYHFSHTSHPLVQIYLANESVVIELSSSLVLSASRDYANALLRLWKKLPLNVQLVMVLNARERPPAVGEPPRSHIIDAMIGKLALLSEVNERPVAYRIVLTHMDEVPGYPEFRYTTTRENLDTRVRLSRAVPISGFSGGLSHLFACMNNVLVNHKPESFIATLHFLDHVDAIFGVIEQQLVQACQRSGLVDTDLVQLALFGVSAHENVSDLANNPFLDLGAPTRTTRAHSPKHFRRAGVISATLVLGQCMVYWSQKSNIEEVFAMIRRIPAMSSEQYVREAHPVFESLYPPDGSFFSRHSLNHILHRYFSAQIDQAKNELVYSIRANYLIPKLELVQFQSNAYVKTIRALALLHANRNNELSEYFSEVHKEYGLGMPLPLINDYITFNEDINDAQMLGLALHDYGVFEVINRDDVHPWKVMADQIKSALGKRYITREELLHIQETGNQLSALISQVKEFKTLDQQRHWLERHGHISQATLAEWRRHPTEGQLTYEPLEDSLRLILDSNIDDDSQPSNLYELLMELGYIIDRHKMKDTSQLSGVVRIEMSNKVFDFNHYEWQSLMLRSKLKALMEQFYRTHYFINGWSFFDQGSHPYRLPMGVSTDGAGVLTNSFQVDERLTRGMFDSHVKPAVQLLATLLPRLTVDDQEKQRLVDFVVQNLSVYASHYAATYWGFFSDMQLRINNPFQLLQYLRELQRPGSEFYQNLIAIKENIILDIPSGPNFQAFREEMENFRFLQRLLEEQGGNFPQLMRYMQIIIEVNDELFKPKMYIPVVDATAVGAGLQPILTPMGRLAMDMILNTDASYLRKTEEWIREMAIPDHWQHPFLLPMEKLRDYGRLEINQSIASHWSELWGRAVEPMLGLFPFDANQTVEGNIISAEQLARSLHPLKGEFWQGVNSVYRSLFTVNETQWVPAPSVIHALQFPPQMLARLNAAAQLTAALWGPQGIPSPLVMDVKADLLPDLRVDVDEDNLPHASLAYLRSGESSVLGFNQHISWQPFKYEWWQSTAASVGVEFISGDQKIKKYSGVDVDESMWALFRLLQQADIVQQQSHYDWTIPHPLAPEHRIKVGYTFRKNPFDLFRALNTR
jgi:hypothetical protein